MAKRALLIGINYFNTPSELRGCHNDVDDMQKLLINHFGFKAAHIKVMKDHRKDPRHIHSLAPTRDKILRELRTLVNLTKAGDELFVHYSGHGTWTRDLNNDEKDGRDELICPVDENFISDDELYGLLVDGLVVGAKLRCVFDCCHSGTMLDLPYRWKFDDKAYNEHFSVDIEQKNILMISGCRDDQTSADAYIGRKYAGALTWAFCTAVREFVRGRNKQGAVRRETTIRGLSWKDVVYNVRYRLRSGQYDQVPEMTYCHEDQIKGNVDL